MAIVAVTGDAVTTTAVALAAAWPVRDDVILVEADPTGGDLAAWFDLPVAPSLSTVVTRVLDGAWPEIERHTRLAENGIRLLPTPSGAAEATQAVTESARVLVPTLAGMRSPVVIADAGRTPPVPSANPFVAAASVTVVVHRQSTQSPRAAVVRLQRLVEQVEMFVATPTALVVAVLGGTPYSIDEVEAFVHESVGATAVVGLPRDELAASAFAGRTGVSERRQARLPLSRAARDLATTVARSLSSASDHLWRAAR